MTPAYMTRIMCVLLDFETSLSTRELNCDMCLKWIYVKCLVLSTLSQSDTHSKAFASKGYCECYVTFFYLKSYLPNGSKLL